MRILHNNKHLLKDALIPARKQGSFLPKVNNKSLIQNGVILNVNKCVDFGVKLEHILI